MDHLKITYKQVQSKEAGARLRSAFDLIFGELLNGDEDEQITKPENQRITSTI